MPHFEEHRSTVQTVLDELGAGEKPRLLAFNKADLLDAAARDGTTPAPAIAGRVFVSALTGYGMDTLRAEIAALLASMWVDVDVCLPYAAGELLARVRERGTIELEYGEREVRVVGRVVAAAGRRTGGGSRALDRSDARGDRGDLTPRPPSAGDRADPRRGVGEGSGRDGRDLDGRRGPEGEALARGRRARRRRASTRSCSRPTRTGGSAISSLPAPTGCGPSTPRPTGRSTATMSGPTRACATSPGGRSRRMTR